MLILVPRITAYDAARLLLHSMAPATDIDQSMPPAPGPRQTHWASMLLLIDGTGLQTYTDGRRTVT